MPGIGETFESLRLFQRSTSISQAVAATTPNDVAVVINRQSVSRYVIHVLNQYVETRRDQRTGMFRLEGLKLKLNTVPFGPIAKIEVLDDNAEAHELKFNVEGKWAMAPLPPLGVNALLLVSVKGQETVQK